MRNNEAEPNDGSIERAIWWRERRGQDRVLDPAARRELAALEWEYATQNRAAA